MKILDCTLRDGGYYTQWDFNSDLVTLYINAMNKLPIDYLEIGYRSNPKNEYFGKFFYLPDFVVESIGKQVKNAKLAIMLNEKDVNISDIDTILLGLKPYVSLIRMAVAPANFERALTLGKAIKSKGFDIAFNMMYMSVNYNNDQFIEKLSQLNGVVSYLNLVDSFGGMTPEQVTTLFLKVKQQCSEKLGFHGHNNMELAFANTLAAMNTGCDIIDSTIMGMGRGAGNLKTELLLTYLASQDKVKFDFNELAGIVEAWLPLHAKYEWGTNLPYMVSGATSMPQKDVMEWITQRFYSYNSIIRALKNQEAGTVDNIRLPIFKAEESFENVIIIGGGPSAMEHARAIKRFIAKFDNICIIHASAKNAAAYQDVNASQYFCLVGNEGHRLEKVFSDLQKFDGECVLPPYPRKMGTYIPDLVINRSMELETVDFTDDYLDSHTTLALQTAKNLDAKTVYLAGYDGYNENLITPREQALSKENEYTFNMFAKNHNLISILPTQYNMPITSVYSLL